MSENVPVVPSTPWPPGWRDPGPEPTTPRRPGTVLAAAVVTWVSAAVMAGGAVSFLVFVLTVGDPIFDYLDADSRRFVLGMVALVVGWSLAASLLARWVLAGRQWARLLLAGSAGLTVVASVPTVFFALPIVSLLAGAVVLVLLFIGGANEWFRAQSDLAPDADAAATPFPADRGSV